MTFGAGESHQRPSRENTACNGRGETLAQTGVRLLAKPFDFAQLMLNIYTSTNLAALTNYC